MFYAAFFLPSPAAFTVVICYFPFFSFLPSVTYLPFNTCTKIKDQVLIDTIGYRSPIDYPDRRVWSEKAREHGK